MTRRLAWILFCLVAVPAAARADTRRAAMRREVFDKLELSTDQKRGLLALHERRQEKEAALARELDEAKRALAAASSSSSSATRRPRDPTAANEPKGV
jgi:hypothetical protein